LKCLVTTLAFVCASLFGTIETPPDNQQEEKLYTHYESYREAIHEDFVDKENRTIRLLERRPEHVAEVQATRARVAAEFQAQKAREEAARQAARAAERAAELEEEPQAEVVRTNWTRPVADYRITATFGQSGEHWANGHTGLDLAAPTGTTVVAVGHGEVIFAGSDGPYGNKIVIRHDDGTESWYCHLSSFAVDSGEVAAGDKIGEVGATGNVTGPHLHLEIRDNGTIDPYTWLEERGVDL
jgi:murein DD-endopeptidase MepM/ murein hydrolase activator NlpD